MSFAGVSSLRPTEVAPVEAAMSVPKVRWQSKLLQQEYGRLNDDPVQPFDRDR